MNETESAVRGILGYTAEDRDFWERELAGFVPEQIFDAHVHLWNNAFTLPGGMLDNDWSRYNTRLKDQQYISSIFYPKREVHYLAFATPVKKADYNLLNPWVASEVNHDSISCAAMLVAPEMTGEYVNKIINRYPQFVALKPYYLFASKSLPKLCDYLPEVQMEIANMYNLAIILHLPDEPERSLDDLEFYAVKYPRVKWILAHCAASFHPSQIKKMIHRLCVIPNVWYDLAVITHIETFVLLLKHANRQRILFGSDNALIIGGCRRETCCHDSFSGLPQQIKSHTPFRCYKQLMAMQRACKILDISRETIKDIFYGNSIKLFTRYNKY